MSLVLRISMLLATVLALGVEPREASAQASADYYLKLDGVDGELAVSGLAWDTAADVGQFAQFTHEVQSPRDVATGQASGRQVQPTTVVSPRDAASGMPTGKRQHKPMTVIMHYGPASPRLLQGVVSGSPVGDIVIWSRDEGGLATLRYTLKDAIITSYSIQGAADASSRPRETVSFSGVEVQVAPAAAGAANLNMSKTN